MSASLDCCVAPALALDDVVTTIITAAPSTNKYASDSLRVVLLSILCYAPALAMRVLLAFDGIDPPPAGSVVAVDRFGFHYGSRCASPASAAQYQRFIAKATALANAILPRQPSRVFAPERRCLAGTLALALEATFTPYVFVTQSDRPVSRCVDWSALLSTMRARSSAVQAVWLPPTDPQKEKRAEHKACTGDGGRSHPQPLQDAGDELGVRPRRNRSAPIAVTEDVVLMPRRYWSDATLLARASHYSATAWPALRAAMADERAWMQGRFTVAQQAGFMEWHLFCHPFRNQSGWGTWNLVSSSLASSALPYTTHLDSGSKLVVLSKRFDRQPALRSMLGGASSDRTVE